MNRYTQFIKAKWFLFGMGLTLGVLVILGIRFATYHPEDEVHYHANFAMYLNGQREQFKEPFYYVDLEESCTLDQQITPHERAHMHDNVNDVVHVEDQAVTWGQFFQNLGWVVDLKVIRTPNQVLLTDAQNKVTFILNGEQTDNVLTRVIKDQDRLLVDYGNATQQDLQKEYSTVPATAHKYDITQDPASCSGHKTTTMHDRFVHML